MKAKLKQNDAVFEPVVVEITLETKRELDTFATLLNYAPVCDVFTERSDGGVLSEILRVLQDAGADAHQTSAFNDLIIEQPAIQHSFKAKKP